MQTDDLIKEIKKDFRAAMNGAVSKSMRDKGLTYKINFGIELPRLKELASHYPKDHDLAQTLWKEDVRESKIMATLLQPIDTFYSELADIWVDSIRFPEMAEIACMHLFQYLPYASDIAFRWVASEQLYVRLCGFLLLARLFMQDTLLNQRAENEFFDQALAELQSDEYLTRNAAILALKKYGGMDRDHARRVSKALAPLQKSGNPMHEQAANEIKLSIVY